MKKLILLFLALCCMSCVHTINEEGIVVGVEMLESESMRYLVTISSMDRQFGVIKMKTNYLYQVGDTVKIVKR